MHVLSYLSLGLWLLLPLAAYGVTLVWGTPHLIVSYTFYDNGRPYDPFADRHYTSCTFVGLTGRSVTTPADFGRCGWVRFFKENDA